MTFTDDDLKRLKDLMTTSSKDWVDGMNRGYMLCLIARLEAAEKLAEMVPDSIEGVHEEWCGMECKCGPDKAAVEAWRKAAGK